ncbi:MAG: hypothetical protein ACXW18_07395 [Pyrinomonadaceae bacterium]
MARKALTKTVLIGAGLAALLTIAVSLEASVPRNQNQNQTKLRITVNGKRSGQSRSVEGADILLKANNGNFEANPSTDSQGIANISQVPFGKVVIQVTAVGWRTFGHTYDLNRREQTITIELKPAAEPTPTPTPTPSPE